MRYADSSMSALAAAGKQWGVGVTLISVDRQRDEGTKHEVLLQQVSSASPDRGDDREKSIFLTFQVSCLSGSYRNIAWWHYNISTLSGVCCF